MAWIKNIDLERMNVLGSLFQNPTFLVVVLIINFLLMISFLVITFIIGKAYKQLNERYVEFMSKLGEGNKVEEILKEYLNIVERNSKKITQQKDEINRLESNLKKCVQKVGLIRYNAYKDTGSDLSFTMALMDAEENGVVVNGLYSRDSSSIFAKPLVKGETKYNLSAEEIQAIDIARTSSNSRY